MLDGIKQWFESWANPAYEGPTEPPAVQMDAKAVEFNIPAGAERAITRLYNLYKAKQLDENGPSEIVRYQHIVGGLGFKVPNNASECVALLVTLKG